MKLRPLFEFISDNDAQHTSTVRFNCRYRTSDGSASDLTILKGVVIDIPKEKNNDKRAKLFAVLGHLPIVSDIEHAVYSHIEEEKLSEASVKRIILDNVKRISENVDDEFQKACVNEKARVTDLQNIIKHAKKTVKMIEKEKEERKHRWFGLGNKIDTIMNGLYTTAGLTTQADTDNDMVCTLTNQWCCAEDELVFLGTNSVPYLEKEYRKQFDMQLKGDEAYLIAEQQNRSIENAKVVTGISLDLGEDATKRLEALFKSMYEANRANHRRTFIEVETKDVSKPLLDYMYDKGQKANLAFIANELEKEYVKNGLALPDNVVPIRFVIELPSSLSRPNEDMLVTITTFGRTPGLFKMEETNRYNTIDLEHSHEDTYTSYRFIDGKKLAKALHCGYKVAEYGHLNEKGEMEYEKSDCRRVVPTNNKNKLFLHNKQNDLSNSRS